MQVLLEKLPSELLEDHTYFHGLLFFVPLAAFQVNRQQICAEIIGLRFVLACFSAVIGVVEGGGNFRMQDCVAKLVSANGRLQFIIEQDVDIDNLGSLVLCVATKLSTSASMSL